jgi:hypothetical protein
VVVPESAHGFAVEALGVVYGSAAAEFGLAVSEPLAAVGERQRASELQVFSGRVNVDTPGGKRVARVRLGEAVHVADGAVRPVSVAEPGRFPTPGTVGLERWNRWRETSWSDPSLVCYFPFLEDPDDDRVLRDHAAHGQALNGRIRGARWVSGRWPGKQALLFDRAGDAVELELPGEFRQLTMAAWVNLDRMDYEMNMIVGSDEWEPGDFHWQLNRSGEDASGLYKFVRKRMERVASPVPLGRWVHVATVVDLDRRTTSAYVDGERVAETLLAPPLPKLTPGRCRIGDWLRRPDWDHAPERGLRGRIDELAVWRRALKQDELRGLVRIGRPSLLEAVARGGPL